MTAQATSERSVTGREEGNEARLWDAVRKDNDPGAREEIFGLYSPLADGIARIHLLDRRQGAVEFDDLRQLAYAGLLEAIDRFDPSIGVSFAHYAKRRVTGSILDGVSKMSEVREQVAFRNRMRSERARSLGGSRAGADETPEAAFDRLVEAAVGLAIGFMLEDTGVYATDDTPSAVPDAYRQTAWKEMTAFVRQEVDRLGPQERLVIDEHYRRGAEFQRIAELMDLSKGRVSQIHRSALANLRRRLDRRGDFRLER